MSTRETIVVGASGHQDCVCVPGFAGLPVPDPLHCQECPADTYADVHNTSTCVPCPEHASHALTKRTNVSACLCDPGYSGPDGGPCVACAAGTFKAEHGADLCESCGVNEYSGINASAGGAVTSDSPCSCTSDDDHPFIVLTETKFSFRCIPVWIGTLL